MKKNLVAITALCWSIFSFAQTATFDITTYKIPKGWTKSSKVGVISYTTTNEAKGFCIINLYASSATQGNAGEEFVKYWNEYAVTPFSIKEEPETEKSEGNGWEIISGAGNFTSDDLTNLAMLTVLVGFGRTTCILSITNDGNYEQDIQDFLSSLEIKKIEPATASVPKTTVSTNNNNTTTSSASFTPSNKLEGVWMALHKKVYNFDKVLTGTTKWITFFDNGRTDKLIPDEGMDVYNKNSNSIGYYKINGNTASLQWFTDVPAIPIKFISPDRIEFTEQYNNDIYYRCKSVDGIRLNGSWTSFNNVNDPDLDNNSITRSLITFGKDGSFTDYGIFADDFSDPSPAGSGTYDIRNFTLTLHYSNGTTKKTSFTGSLSNDVKTNDKMIYIHRLAFHKRQ